MGSRSTLACAALEEANADGKYSLVGLVADKRNVHTLGQTRHYR